MSFKLSTTILEGTTMILATKYCDELVKYARALDKERPATEVVECLVCQCAYTTGVGEHTVCPSCYPEALEVGLTLSQLIRRLDIWPGHRFVWDARRGATGQWVLTENWRLTSVDDHVALREVLGDAPVSYSLRPLPAAAEEIRRLRGIVNHHETEIAGRNETIDNLCEERDNSRADKLADRCQVLEDQLRDKRAECDELRDRLGER